MALGNDLMASIADMFRPDNANGMDASIQFDLTGEGGGLFYATIADQAIDTGEGEVDAPDTTIHVGVDDFREMLVGGLNWLSPVMTGRMTIEGNSDLGFRFWKAVGR